VSIVSLLSILLLTAGVLSLQASDREDHPSNDSSSTLTTAIASFVRATITSGNGDGKIDVNECNLISVVITNLSGSTLTNVVGTLVPKTPGVSVMFGVANYSTIPASDQGTNTTWFQFGTGPSFVCGSILEFELQLQAVGRGAFSVPFSLPSGPDCSDGGGLCESCPEGRIIRGTIGAGSLHQDGRLNRNGIASVCGSTKICPGLVGAGTLRGYDAYVFQNGESNACITASLQSDCSVFCAAYQDAYTSEDVCLNYLADPGVSPSGGAPANFSFSIAAFALFVIVVNEVNPGPNCGYILTINGGSCRPLLNFSQIAADTIAFDWSTSAVGHSLERANLIGDPQSWVPLPETPNVNGGRFHIIDVMSVPPTNSFYRLRKP